MIWLTYSVVDKHERKLYIDLYCSVCVAVCHKLYVYGVGIMVEEGWKDLSSSFVLLS